MTKRPIHPVFNMETAVRENFAEGDAWESQDTFVGNALGLTQIGAVHCVVPPGKSACPFHNHHREDEMFVILAGEGTYRFGPDHYQVKAGDILGAPRGGPETAHKLTNTGSSPLVYLAISSKSDIETCEYPDSGKFMTSTIYPDGSRFRYVGRADEACDYWDGEDSPD